MMSRSSLLYLVTLLISLVVIWAEVENEKRPDRPVVCYGPRGPRGHRGRVGSRGEAGAPGNPGADGTNPGTISLAMEIAYLWSEISNPFGPVYFQGYQMTSGFYVDGSWSNISLVNGGMYMLHLYIRDNMCYTEIRINGVPLPILYDSFQVTGDQLWAQFVITANPGDVLSFYTWEDIPYDPNQAVIPQASGSIFYSATIQLLIPAGSIP